MPARARRLRNATGSLALLCLLAVAGVSQGWLVDHQPATTAQPASSRVELKDLPAFSDAPWADEIKAEHEDLGSSGLPLDSVAEYRLADFDGHYTSVRDGVRDSYRSQCEGCPRITVWWFGGSAAFGWLQRDEHTIPSELVRQAEADGLLLDVRNMAVPGWTAPQEVRMLEHRLETGTDRPDAVLFYDGFNDIVAEVVHAAVTGELNRGEPTALDGGLVLDYRRDQTSLEPVGGPKAVASLAAAKYLDTTNRAATVLSGERIPSWWFLQADAFGSTPQLAAIERMTGSDPATAAAGEFARSITLFQQEIQGAVLDLRQELDKEQRPVFADPVHTNELGAQLIAAAIYREIGHDLHDSGAVTPGPPFAISGSAPPLRLPDGRVGEIGVGIRPSHD